ncbi:MAG: PAS domain-containing protein [Bacteroides sp.]|nr:PAS domain-containing protein [Bacteroides sp.]
MELSSKIVRALPEFIFVFNRDFIFTDVMKSDYVELFHTREELIGSSGRMIYSPEVSEMFIKNIHGCLSDGQLRLMEYSVNFGEKGVRHYEARLTPYDEDNVLVLIRDICIQVEREKELLEARMKAEESDRLKSEFWANISHEIRTPLNAIVGFSEYIISPDFDEEERKEFAKIIKLNSEQLQNLINDVLDLSRIEAGRTEIVMAHVELAELIRQLGRSQEPKLNKEVKLNINIPDELKVVTDASRVSQIVTNFLSNAIKYTEKGEISLSMERIDEGHVSISVKDTGCGISAANLTKVFDRFEKIHSSKQGTGLGLCICKNLADLLGGEVFAHSTLGEGSEFVLILPA